MPNTTDPPEYHLLPDRSAVQVGPREVVVTPTQFRLLAVLMSVPGRTFTRAELVEKGIGDIVELRTVDVHIKELRRKLDPDDGRIQTVRGTGYRYRGHSGGWAMDFGTIVADEWQGLLGPFVLLLPSLVLIMGLAIGVGLAWRSRSRSDTQPSRTEGPPAYGRDCVAST